MTSPPLDDAAIRPPMAKKPRKDRKKPRSVVLLVAMMPTWHPTKNGAKDPRFAPDHDTYIWWACTQKTACLENCTHVHEWQGSIASHFSKDGDILKGCSWCRGHCPCDTKKSRNPRNDVLMEEIMRSWHRTKNGHVDPRTVSGDVLVWWSCICKTNCLDTCTQDHDWQAIISSRFAKDGNPKNGCPYCSSGGKILCPCKSLQARRPDLVQEWHPTRNMPCLPSDVSFGSIQIVWWICTSSRQDSNCLEGCAHLHEWPASIKDRAISNNGCPWCSDRGRKFCPCQSLEVRRPDLSREWHPTYNMHHLPRDFSFSSNKTFVWICIKGHTWNARINNRTSSRASGCPQCKENKNEKRLLQILTSMEHILEHEKKSIMCFDEILGKNRRLIPDAMGVIIANNHEFVLEYDGEQHHKPVEYFGGQASFRLQVCSDIAKNKYASDHGMSLLRIAYRDVKHMEKLVLDFLEYCASTTIPKEFYSSPELYRKTEEDFRATLIAKI